MKKDLFLATRIFWDKYHRIPQINICATIQRDNVGTTTLILKRHEYAVFQQMNICVTD
jgi:hypothetical protein